MAQLFSTLTVMFAVGMALGPDDPVGIGDARVEMEPGSRQVSIELERFEALRALAEYEAPLEPGPGPWSAERSVQLERLPEGVRVRVTWRLQTITKGWWWGPIVGPMAGLRVESLTWRGRDAGVMHTPAGEEVALKMEAETSGELKLVAFVPADRLPGGIDGDFELWLLPAARGELRLGKGAAPEGRVAELLADGQPRRAIDGRFWTGEARLGLTWVEAKAADASEKSQAPLAVAHTAVGLTFGDGEVRGRARVSWLVRRGQLAALSLDTAGLGRDLELSGPNVREWRRAGDRIEVELEAPVEGRVDLDLRWTQGVPGGAEATLASPRITPEQVYRSESFMQIARDGELEVLPKLAGWSAVARAELPQWAGGYIQGTATASFRRDGDDRGASFELLRFVPVSGPPVVVDIAAYEVATSDEGRSMVQARYDVRNERASHLRVELPPNSRMLGVRVNGETVTPARDAGVSGASSGEAWRIPIVRSLESVTGTLSFPVEIIFINEDDSWEKKEARELRLPTLDAPVAVSRVRVYLPPRYGNRVDVGDFHRVADFSEGEGITYGLGVGAGAGEVSRADELYRGALSSWMANDFKGAQSSLDELGELGAFNANISGLQANLDLVQGRDVSNGDRGDGDVGGDGGGQSAVVSRRIKEQARMRAAEEEIELLKKAEEANKLEARGDYAQAEEVLAEAQEIGDRLAMLEQSESKEQLVYNQALSSSSDRVKEKKKSKASRESDATRYKKKKKESKRDKNAYALEDLENERAQVYSFEDDQIEGELLIVDGATMNQPEAEPEPLFELETKFGYASGPGSAPVPLPNPDPSNGVGNSAEAPPPVGAATVTRTTATVTEEHAAQTQSISMDEAKALPIIEDESRDFTSFDSEPMPDEAPMAMDVQRSPRKSRKNRGGKGRGAKGKDGKAAPPPPPAPPSETPTDTSISTAVEGLPVQDPNAALAGPVVTASAVSVHIPAIGEAVMYQHMLLPEGKALTVHLEARRHKPSKSK